MLDKEILKEINSGIPYRFVFLFFKSTAGYTKNVTNHVHSTFKNFNYWNIYKGAILLSFNTQSELDVFYKTLKNSELRTFAELAYTELEKGCFDFKLSKPKSIK